MIKTEKLVYAFHYGRGADESIERSHLTRRTRRICRYNGTFRMRQVNVAELFWGTLDSPTSGSYFFEGKQVDKMNENQLTALRKNNLGFIFQSFNLIDELTVYENVELPLVGFFINKSHILIDDRKGGLFCVIIGQQIPYCIIGTFISKPYLKTIDNIGFFQRCP